MATEHAPTPRRRALGRAAGRVLTSPAATAALSLGLATVAAIVVVDGSAHQVAAATRSQLAHAGDDDAIARVAAAARAVPLQVLTLVAPIVAAAMLGGLGGTTALARGLWIPRRTVRDAPTAGAEPTTAGQRAVEAAIGLARTAILLAVATAAVVTRLPILAAAAPAARGQVLLVTAGSALATVAIAAIATSLLEVGWRWYRLERSLVMTDRQWRDELRTTHGDPSLRQARRAARVDDRALIAAARAVVVADDVAVAIGWRRGEAPRPIAIGRRLDARRVVAAARAAQVPVVADAALAIRIADAGAIDDAALAPVAALLAAVGVSAAS